MVARERDGCALGQVCNPETSACEQAPAPGQRAAFNMLRSVPQPQCSAVTGQHLVAGRIEGDGTNDFDMAGQLATPGDVSRTVPARCTHAA